MNSPESRTTIITAVAAAPVTRSARGKFFRSSMGFGGASKGARADGYAWPKKPSGSSAMRREEGGDPHRFAFGLLYLFTLLLYVRPNDLIPAMGAFPLAKIVAIIAPLAYIYAQYMLGKPVFRWTIEVKMVIVMLLLAVMFTPFAVSPGDSFTMLNEVFIKTVTIFILIIGVVNTRERLWAIVKLTVLCGTCLVVFAIK